MIMSFFDTIKRHGYFFCKRIIFGGQYLYIDYPVEPRPHWKNGHSILKDMISSDKERYLTTLKSFLPYCENLAKSPGWKIPKNRYFGGLDAVVLYGLVSTIKPGKYVEIGSGFSTIFASSAKKDYSPDTQIICIDPSPRSIINDYCDTFIRKRLEDIDLSFFSSLNENDILFIDNSHRVFTNSDVMTLFFDVFPYLKNGVIVEMHDIFLPCDYPKEWNDRYYSEQYLIGAYLLGGKRNWDIIMPDAFMLQENLVPEEMEKFGLHGGSFWFKIRNEDAELK